jgi:hypothetical protein
VSISGEVPRPLVSQLRTSASFFSSYIPGISGIPNQETKSTKRVVLKACSYGDSNVFLRNALHILDDSQRRTLEGWLQPLIGPIRIDVRHVPEKDLNIRCSVKLNNIDIPLELVGTGFLQLIQIFCYILIYKPKMLLIDEPDTHLHPDIQEKLVRILDTIAAQNDLCVILATHSPFIVRGAMLDTKVYWLQDGRIASTSRESIEMQLGWGGFGKRLLIISEDSDTSLLRAIIAQWPELERQVAFYPRNGLKSLPKPEEATHILEALGRCRSHLFVRIAAIELTAQAA